MAPVQRKKPKSQANTKAITNVINSSKSSQPLENIDGGKKVQHFVPLPLVMTVMVCSGVLWTMCFRDVFATGRPILGPQDELYQMFLKSTQFFEVEQNGYFKSRAGGLSAISQATTNGNNMGALFVRKLCGAAGLAVHSQKLAGFLFQGNNAHWYMGHFNPMVLVACIGNLALALFVFIKMDDLSAAGLKDGALLVIAISIFEFAFLFGYYLSVNAGAVGIKLKNLGANRTPKSVVSRIVMRTVSIVSGVQIVIAARDLFFPGSILEYVPRDDIYLEWTGALIHSPPAGSIEEDDHLMESPLFIGDKFASQLCALYLLIGCLYKFSTAFFIRLGKDKSGEIKCKIIWRVQVIASMLTVTIMRLFASAALSASLDLRWHLMCVVYETLIIGKFRIFCVASA